MANLARNPEPVRIGQIGSGDELLQSAHALAYRHASSEIDTYAMHIDSPDGVWFELTDEDLQIDGVSSSLRYLEARGLIEHNLMHHQWIRVRDESEATA